MNFFVKTHHWVFLILFISLQNLISAQPIKGVISDVIDGDTFKMIAENKKITVRLNGIDCPENDQLFGNNATDFLKRYLYHQVELHSHGTDRYRRILADVYVDGICINHQLVDSGFAWHYKKYSDDELIAQKEQRAREDKIGLWGMESYTAPWDWRAGKRKVENPYTQTDHTPIPRFTSADDSITMYMICNSSGSKRFHKSPNCKGMQNCKSEVLLVDIEQAGTMGKTECGYCFGSP